MKARPRSVEREVARHLTEYSARIGASPVERIPVLGRTGPDISTNELGLVMDVKSRLQVPQGYFESGACRFGSLVGIELDQMDLLLTETPRAVDFTSVLVERWFLHMDAWRSEFLPSGVTAIVLHRPKMPIGQSKLIIHHTSVEELKWKIQQLQSTHLLRTEACLPLS
jgi:hypothetical protein